MTIRYRHWIFVFFIGVMFFSLTKNVLAATTTSVFNEAMFSQAEPPSRQIDSLNNKIKSVSEQSDTVDQPAETSQKMDVSSEKADAAREQMPGSQSNRKLTKGIYISQTTAEDTKYFTYLIERSKKVGNCSGR